MFHYLFGAINTTKTVYQPQKGGLAKRVIYPSDSIVTKVQIFGEDQVEQADKLAKEKANKKLANKEIDDLEDNI